MSLRELIEWVIRKDTELTGLGPVCGDVAALQKQEVSILQLLLFHITELSFVPELSSRNLGLLWTISYEFRSVSSNLKNLTFISFFLVNVAYRIAKYTHR